MADGAGAPPSPASPSPASRTALRARFAAGFSVDGTSGVEAAAPGRRRFSCVSPPRMATGGGGDISAAAASAAASAGGASATAALAVPFLALHTRQLFRVIGLSKVHFAQAQSAAASRLTRPLGAPASRRAPGVAAPVPGVALDTGAVLRGAAGVRSAASGAPPPPPPCGSFWPPRLRRVLATPAAAAGSASGMM